MPPHESTSIENTTPTTSKRSNVLGFLLALILAGGSFVTGLQASEMVPSGNQEAGLFSFFAAKPATTPVDDADLTEFWRVWNLLEEKFIAASTTASLTPEQKVHGAIEGLVNSYGDPYTVFFPPVESEAFAEEIGGNFSGIGMEVGLRGEVITVISPLPDTPAERAGIVAGDVIVRIDGESTEGLQIDEAVSRIRGEKGTTVTLSVFREGESEFKEFVVVRDTITVPTIETIDEGDVFVIQLYSFNALAEAKMQEALREYIKSGAEKLVIDLRGNPGGYLQSAVAIAGYFLPTGKIVVRESFREGGEEKVYRSVGRAIKEFTPKDVVVLIDNGSASASEILAGALKEHGVATVIGVDSFGKGSVQELVELSDGSSVKITVARWLTPNGLSISDGGLKPNIRITRTPQQRLEEVDPQLEAALKFLRGGEVVSEPENTPNPELPAGE